MSYAAQFYVCPVELASLTLCGSGGGGAGHGRRRAVHAPHQLLERGRLAVVRDERLQRLRALLETETQRGA